MLALLMPPFGARHRRARKFRHKVHCLGDPNQGIESTTYSCVYADANNGRRRQNGRTPTFCTQGTSAATLTLGNTNTQTQVGYNEPPMEWSSALCYQSSGPRNTPAARTTRPAARSSCSTVRCNHSRRRYAPYVTAQAAVARTTATNAHRSTMTRMPTTTRAARIIAFESPVWYQECRTRGRNKGLFTADRNMNNRNQARSTRQNPNGGRSGTSAKADYYPYWLATPWRDIAVLTSTLAANTTPNTPKIRAQVEPRWPGREGAVVHVTGRHSCM